MGENSPRLMIAHVGGQVVVAGHLDHGLCPYLYPCRYLVVKVYLFLPACCLPFFGAFCA